jgi:hypothetical protein
MMQDVSFAWFLCVGGLSHNFLSAKLSRVLRACVICKTSISFTMTCHWTAQRWLRYEEFKCLAVYVKFSSVFSTSLYHRYRPTGRHPEPVLPDTNKGIIRVIGQRLLVWRTERRWEKEGARMSWTVLPCYQGTGCMAGGSYAGGPPGSCLRLYHRDWDLSWISQSLKKNGAPVSVVVKTLCYKPEGRVFETRWGKLIFFSAYLILSAALGPVVNSTYNTNGYQKKKNNVSGE